MSNSIQCPKCKSDQVSVQKRGFSGGKAVAGVVLTGGVGALAGLHGSDKIDVHCLACGNVWDPVKYNEKQKLVKQQKASHNYNNRKRKFYQAYEADNLEEAQKLAETNWGALTNEMGIEGVYKKLKSEDRISSIVTIIMISIPCLIIIWLVSKCS